MQVLLDMSRQFVGNGPEALKQINRQPARADGKAHYRYQTSRNFRPLAPDLLAPYHVVVVIGSLGRMIKPPAGGWPPSIRELGFDVSCQPAEVEAMRQYVEESGGCVILLGSGALWHRRCLADARANHIAPRPVETMPLNQLAAPLGVKFLGKPVRRGGWQRPERDSALGWGSPSFAEVLAGSAAGVLSAPAHATTLIRSNRGEPVAVAFSQGKGFVVAVDLDNVHEAFRRDARLAPGFRTFLDWTMDHVSYHPPQNAVVRELSLPFPSFETKLTRIHAIDSMLPRAAEIHKMAVHAERFIPEFLGTRGLSEFKPQGEGKKLKILVRVSGPAGSAGAIVQVGGYSTDANVPIYHEITHKVWPNPWHPTWFGEPIANYVQYHAMIDYGLKDAAEKWKAAFYRELAVIEQHGKVDLGKADASKTKGTNLKGHWVLHELESMHGTDIMKRYLVAFRAWRQRNPARQDPLTTTELVELLSTAAGRDLKPWFREIGTTLP